MYKLTRRVFFITVAALCVNILLDFILVPLLGIKGAAIATTLSMLAMTLLQFNVTMRYLKLRDVKQFLPLFITGLTFLILIFLKPGKIIGTLFVILITGISFLFARKMAIFSKSDIDILNKIDMPIRLKKIAKYIIGVLA